MKPEQIQNRRRIVEMSYEAKTAHLGSALSAVDIIESVFFIKKPGDKFVLSNGHAAVALYAVMERYGLIQNPSVDKLGVHPERNLDLGIEVSTGSLGQGLPIAVGMALADRDRNVYCCVSDGECAEGSVWEALRVAGEQKLDNLKIIVNANGFDAYDPVDLELLLMRLQASECAVLIVDGHDLEELTTALTLKVNHIPLVLFAKTDVEQLPMLSGLAAHYKVLNQGEYEQALKSLDDDSVSKSSPSEVDRFEYFRDKAAIAEIPVKKVQQIRLLCETFANGKDAFEIPDWGLNALSGIRTNDDEWVIQFLRSINYGEDSGTDYLSTYFAKQDGSIMVVHLDLRNEPRSWWWSSRPSFDALNPSITPDVLSGTKSDANSRTGEGHFLGGGPLGLISLLQERLVVATSLGNGEKINFDTYELTRNRKLFRKLVKSFIETCRKYPNQMIGANVHLGSDFLKFGRDASLGVAMEVVGESGIRTISEKKFDTLQLSEFFRIITRRTYYRGEWLVPDYFLTFRSDDQLACFLEVGERSNATRVSKQLRQLCEYLTKEGVLPEPLLVTQAESDRWFIQGIITENPKPRVWLCRFLTCIVDADDSVIASCLQVDDDLKGETVEELRSEFSNMALADPQRFVKLCRTAGAQQITWLVRELQYLVVSTLARSNGDEIHQLDKNGTQAITNTVSYFVRACRDTPDFMTGAEVTIWIGDERFFDTELGKTVLTAFEDVGLIDAMTKIKTNQLVPLFFKTKMIQLGGQFRLRAERHPVCYPSPNCIEYVLTFKENQL